MNKKFLSAILFGALMITSTGTFVSCKDYDDDIENLQTQIDANAKSIADLKASLDGANYVTSVTVSGNNLVVTTKNGGSTTIALPADEKGSMVSVNADGYLVIDGEVTDIKACEATEEGEYLAPVKIEGGEWMVLQEDGTYAPLGLKASSVAVTGNETDGYVLTVTDGEGNETEIELPTAASSLTDLILVNGNETDTLKVATYNFTYAGPLDNISKWKGPKALPKNGKIVAGVSFPMVQVNPTAVDAADLNLKLVDSKNSYPSNIVLTPVAYKGLLVARAANENGLYSLAMADKHIEKANDYRAFMNQFTNNAGDNKLYAVTAGGDVRSEYQLVVAEGDTAALEYVYITPDYNSFEGIEVGETLGTGAGVTEVGMKVDANVWYYVEPEAPEAMYDMHLSVSDDDKTLWGIEIEEVAGQYRFRATKTPDNITKAGFKLTIETVCKNGHHKSTYAWIGQTSLISDAVVYDLITWELKSDDNKNFFNISLDKMKNAMTADELALWNTKANAASIYYLDKDGYAVAYGTTTGIDSIFVSELKGKVSENEGKTVGSTLKNAKNIVFAIDNATAANNFKVGDQYTAIITFYNGSDELNTIYVPFKFTVPAITSLFEIDPGFIKNGVVDLYLYNEDKDLALAGDTLPSFMLSRVFKKFETTGYSITLDAVNKVGATNKKSNELAILGDKNITLNDTVAIKADTLAVITLGNGTSSGDIATGYAQALELTIFGKFANAWEYADADEFKFKAAIKSPIKEGKITPKSGSVVTIKASDLDGYKFSNDVITGYTYNSQVKYSVLPNKVGASADELDWTRNDIMAVKAISGNKNYFTVANDGAATAATYVDNDPSKGVVDGAFVLEGKQVSNTSETTIEIVVTDIWGYSTVDANGKGVTVPVKITVE